MTEAPHAPVSADALAGVLDSLDQAVLATDQQGRVVHANAAARRWLDGPIPLLGQPLSQALQALDETLRQQVLTLWPQALQGQAVKALDGQLQHQAPQHQAPHERQHPGQPTAVSCRLLPWCKAGGGGDGVDGDGGEGAVTGVLLVFAPAAAPTAEVSAEEALRRLRDTLEEQVLQRTAELRQARDEMEAFSYSVSHDLRTPLSAVDGFSSLLEELLTELPAEQGASALKYLSRIRSGIHQMGELIDALLCLARLSRAALDFGEVDLSALATQVLDGLQEREPARSVRHAVQPGLVTHGDARLLKLVLDNLLGNAWKFSRHGANTLIEVGRCSPAEGGAFFVRDQGAGFDMAHAERLFNPFQRLHTTSEFEGTGIGLATVQRIVSRHGGRVWAVSEPGQGATFYFTLAADAAPAAASAA